MSNAAAAFPFCKSEFCPSDRTRWAENLFERVRVKRDSLASYHLRDTDNGKRTNRNPPLSPLGRVSRFLLNPVVALTPSLMSLGFFFFFFILFVIFFPRKELIDTILRTSSDMRLPLKERRRPFFFFFFFFLSLLALFFPIAAPPALYNSSRNILFFSPPFLSPRKPSSSRSPAPPSSFSTPIPSSSSRFELARVKRANYNFVLYYFFLFFFFYIRRTTRKKSNNNLDVRSAAVQLDYISATTDGYSCRCSRGNFWDARERLSYHSAIAFN
ncbi:hypothetical protein PUN28_000197 [Cardiocondyla obscurior]|uniref:Transmembrane protein n=1 Tax=Cardiocondyla obscurior TaxID=286306 RepID=A0AAW2GY72_9HYME